MKTFDNVTVINFCDENFQQTRSLCSKSAIEKGKATRVIEYSPKMIDEIFKRQNHDILSQTRGAGLWIWKPYFIKKTLEEMREGEYLFYTDAGVIFIKPIQYILDFIKTFNQDIIPFELPLLESEWSKKETAYAVADLTIIADNFNDADCETFNNHGYYVCNSQTVNTQTLMSTERKHGKSYVRSWDCVKQEYGKVWSGRWGGNNLITNQFLASYILIRNTAMSRAFVNEWLNLMSDKRCSWPENITHTQNESNFIEHREDQSVFSLLCKKYGLKPFKDPSQFGERPYEYAWKKKDSNKWKKYSYYDLDLPKSKYPKILISVRNTPDPIKFVKKDKIITLLRKLGIYNKWTYKLKYKANYKILN